METNQFSEVYYFWADSENNTYGVTVTDSGLLSKTVTQPKNLKFINEDRYLEC